MLHCMVWILLDSLLLRGVVPLDPAFCQVLTIDSIELRVVAPPLNLQLVVCCLATQTMIWDDTK